MSLGDSLPYWHIDAFAAAVGEGNPAGVVLLDGELPASAMARFAAETGLPATTFVSPAREDGLVPVCWYSPRGAIGLCGHGSLAVAHLLLQDRAEGETLRLLAPDGRLLEARRGQGSLCELALPALPTTVREMPALAAALGTEPVSTRWHAAGYALAVFETADEVLALAPDFAALAALGNWQVTATAPGQAEDVVSRVFRPGGEDAATGSAHAVLAPYWCERLGVSRFTARQASARGASIDCRLDGERVWLGGACVTVVEGRCYLVG